MLIFANCLGKRRRSYGVLFFSEATIVVAVKNLQLQAPVAGRAEDIEVFIVRHLVERRNILFEVVVVMSAAQIERQGSGDGNALDDAWIDGGIDSGCPAAA